MTGDHYQLNRLSLRYREPEIEAQYLSGYTQTVAASLVPILVVLIPFVGLVVMIELAGLLDTPVSAGTASLLLLSLIALFVLAKWIGRFIELGVLMTFLAFDLILLSHVNSNRALVTFMPALILVIVMTQCVGMRFMVALAASAVFVLILVAFVELRGLDPSLLTDAFTFLCPGYAIAASAGYTVERQRRVLFAQVRITQAERDAHEQAALQDPLTGLANRTRLQEELATSLARAKRRAGQFVVIFVDLDDFKQVNDTWNHAMGDRVLVHVAESLKQQIRTEDTVARIGGDEFVVLSDQIVNEADALASAQRVAEAVSTPFRPSEDRPAITVSCSVGVAMCPRDGETIDALMATADQAMYAAKRAGKARVSLAPDKAGKE